jgi:YbbR domain-containing protein
LPRDVTIASSLPDHVDVEVSGSPRKLALERFQMAAVLLDLSGIAQPGQKTFTLNASNVILPDGVVFRRAVPSQLQLLFDRTAVRELEPRVNISQPPPEGYQVTRKEVSPSRLVVTGPERRMRDLEFVQTDPIDLSGVVGEREFRVAAAVTDPQVRFVSPTLVTVRITVEKK